MVKVMYNNQLGYKVVIWVFWGISWWKENVTLTALCWLKRSIAQQEEKGSPLHIIRHQQVFWPIYLSLLLIYGL